MLARLFAAAVVVACLSVSAEESLADGRHYYSSWTYYPQRTYYYVYYYYKPYETATEYNYHYCIYYPATPRYVYYYNPYSKYYWGRYDTKEKGYSLLEEKDRKTNLKDIPESAFPKPSNMPAIPESKDGEKMLPPPKAPTDEPKDLP
jgi:hypothetical protein